MHIFVRCPPTNITKPSKCRQSAQHAKCNTYEGHSARRRYQEQGQILWGVITCHCPWYLLPVQHSSYHHHSTWCIVLYGMFGCGKLTSAIASKRRFLDCGLPEPMQQLHGEVMDRCTHSLTCLPPSSIFMWIQWNYSSAAAMCEKRLT